jgi:hypothetical protein
MKQEGGLQYLLQQEGKEAAKTTEAVVNDTEWGSTAASNIGRKGRNKSN